MSKFRIPLKTLQGEASLLLFAAQETLGIAEDAEEFGEARFQLLEGSEYDYRFESIDHINFCDNPLVRPSEDEEESRGRIITGNYVGTLHLNIKDSNGLIIATLDFEVRSKKTDYRKDYRKMLSDITSYYTELVMLSSSPVNQKFEPDNEEDCRTLYQKFAFVKSIIDSEEFEDAIHKILYNPVRKWTDTTIDRPIAAARRIGRNGLKQIASSSNRMHLPQDIELDVKLNSIPRKLTVPYKKETNDTVENRFVKFVLKTFHTFCRNIQDLSNASESGRLISEAALCCEKIENILSYGFFKEIQDPQFVALNSPVLQRREGYREVLQAWTMYDLAAKLTWDGGDNVYEAGKRNIAALYEYWLFFKLLEIISDKFELDPREKSALVKTTPNKINLELKQGKMIMVGGKYHTPTRDLNVRFFYNRTFSHNSHHDKRGSWTTAMRPDYTLSIWTGEISEEAAEKENTIVHIHFDAKYRVSHILLLDKDEADNEDCATLENNDPLKDEISNRFNQEKEQEQLGNYKRGDLLKMHAYNDAIRRTGGSYVLYPGSEDKTLRGFHEIIPGLGAFPVNPNSFEEDSMMLRKFIDDLIENFLNRISQREQKAYYDYKIYKSEPVQAVRESMPEPIGDNRNLIPTGTNVLIGFYKDEGHLKWILRNKWYNTRTGTMTGSLRLDNKILTAKYLLLHGGKDKPQLLLRLKDTGARIISSNNLVRRAIPATNALYQPSSPDGYYIVFDLENNKSEAEFQDIEWDFSRMHRDGILKNSHNSAVPTGITLATLMNYVKR